MKIKKLYDDSIIPTLGSKKAAGLDLYAHIENEIIIKPHETVKIGTGIAVALDNGSFAGIYARSGMATKKNLVPANCVGVIDSDYRGEIIVALHNTGNIESKIEPNERIAQMIFHLSFFPKMEVVDELDDTERSDGGFGSTGEK